MEREIPAGRYDDLLEDKGIPLCGMRYVRYVADDGESYFQWQFDGNQNLSMTIGDLARISASLMAQDDVELED